MTTQDIDDYLGGLPEPKRATLEEVRRRILSIVPNAEQKISYGMPAFAVNGKVVAGFAAFKNHLAFLPHSGRVLGALASDLGGFVQTAGSLHFPIDEPLSSDLIEKLIETKMRQMEADGNWMRPE